MTPEAMWLRRDDRELSNGQDSRVVQTHAFSSVNRRACSPGARGPASDVGQLPRSPAAASPQPTTNERCLNCSYNEHLYVR